MNRFFVMKKALVFTFLLASSCAHAPEVSRERLTYRCLLEPDLCELVDAGAKIANEDGFVTVRDDTYGTLIFLPAKHRTVFTGNDVFLLNHMPQVAPDLMLRTPRLTRHGRIIEVTILRGGMNHDGDIVLDFVNVFEGLGG